MTPDLIRWIFFWSLVGVAGLMTLDSIANLVAWVRVALGREDLNYKLWFVSMGLTAAADVSVVLVSRIM